MVSDSARVLMVESQRLLSGEPDAAPPPAAPSRPILLPGEERLTADDWHRIEGEPGYKRDTFRRSLIEMRQREARNAQVCQPPVSGTGSAERAANRVLARFLDHFMPTLGERIGKALKVRDARIAALERRLAALETQQRGGKG